MKLKFVGDSSHYEMSERDAYKIASHCGNIEALCQFIEKETEFGWFGWRKRIRNRVAEIRDTEEAIMELLTTIEVERE